MELVFFSESKESAEKIQQTELAQQEAYEYDYDDHYEDGGEYF
jgi:hypothetical protein